MAGGIYGGGTTVYKPTPISGGPLGQPGSGLNPTNPNASKNKGSNGQPSGTSKPQLGGVGKPATVSGTGIGLLAVAGLGAIALANTPVGPVIIAALVAAVIWNGQQLVTVVGGKATVTGGTAAS